MKFKTWLTINAILLLIFGLPRLLFPVEFLGFGGLELGGETHWETRIAGGLVLGNVILSWLYREITDARALRAIKYQQLWCWGIILILVVAGMLFYTIPFLWGAIVAPAISHMPDTLVPPVSPKEDDNIVQMIIGNYLPPWFSTFVLMGVNAAAISTCI